MKFGTVAVTAFAVTSVLYVNAVVLNAVGAPWATASAPEAPTQVVEVTPPQPDTTPVVTPGPEPVGAQAAREALQALSVTPVDTEISWPSGCVGSVNYAWAYSTATTTGRQVAVALTPAGQGQPVLDSLRTQLANCTAGQLTNRSDDAFTFTSSGGSLLVTRFKDVVIAVTNPVGADMQQADELTSSILDRLRPVCIGDPGSTTNNPLFDTFVPYAPSVEFAVPYPAFPGVPYPSPQGSYSPSAPDLPRPELAVIYPPNEITNPTNTPLFATARAPAPNLVDPQEIPRPVVARVFQPNPANPGSAQDVAAAQLREPTRLGPGCGWGFAGSLPQNQPGDEQAKLAAADQGVVQAVGANAEWMSRSLDLRNNYEAAQQVVTSNSQWDDYDRALASAQEKWNAREERYQRSLARWFAYQPAPQEPVPTQPQPAAPTPLPGSETALEPQEGAP